MKNKIGKSTTKRLSRYLTEILVIIIGITLSFALNEWNNNRNEYEAYKNHLENLSSDLEIDFKQMKSDRESVNNIKKNLTYSLKYNPADIESIPKLSNAINEIMSYINFLPNNNTFQMLNSTGGLAVFKNKELVSELNQLYQYDYAYIEMMERQKDRVLYEHLMPLLYEEIYFEDALTYPNIRTDVKAFLGNKEFRNICLDYQGACDSHAWSYTRALKRLEKVKKIIEEELE